MEKNDQGTSERAINRALVNVALRWAVDPQQAHHNPVFWRDGYLNYYDPTSHREEVFTYLKGRGILSDGYNGASKLNSGLDELDEVADADYQRGVDLDVVVGLLVAQLVYQHGELYPSSKESGSDVIVWSERTAAILEHLCKLGYVGPAKLNARRDYRWTEKAESMLRRHHLL